MKKKAIRPGNAVNKATGKNRHASLSPSQETPLLFYVLLLSAFFLSGATSLSLEVAWSKELSYLLGVDIYATSTVITAYMLGLGLGAVLAARFSGKLVASLKVYGFLQLAIGISGLVSIPLFRSISPLLTFLYARFDYDSGLFLLGRFAVVFGLMLIPVTLMGMTLPVVVGAAQKKLEGSRYSPAGILYGINTVGAFMGTLAAGFFLVPGLGILKTCLFTGVVDLGIGILVLTFMNKSQNLAMSSQPGQMKKEEDNIPGRPGNYFNLVSVIFFLSGISALAYEIIWFRLLARVIGPTVHAFSIMLAVYLLGIGLGSLLGSRRLKGFTQSPMAVPVLLGFIGFAALSAILFINRLPIWYGSLFVHLTTDGFTLRNLLLQAGIAGILVLPVTIPLGLFFPVMVNAHKRIQKDAARNVGILYFFNTMGGMIGSLVAGFWMLPRLGIDASLIFASALNILLALFVYLKSSSQGPRAKGIITTAACALFLLISLTGPDANQRVLNAGLYSEMIGKDNFRNKILKEKTVPGDLLFFKEGINNSVAVIANKFDDGNLTLHLSGGWVSSTEFHGRLHLEFLGHLPLLAAKHIDSVGVIGFGTGVTSGNVLLYPDVKEVTVFELEDGVMEASHLFEHVNDHPLKDPRLTVVMMDGRSYISYTQKTFDVITADPIHPLMAGAANLYTQDFYRAAAGKLKEGGIFCQWIPLSGISNESFDTILNTMHGVFPHLALFSFFGESVVLASVEPFDTNWSVLEKRFYQDPVFQDFKKMDILTPYNILAFYLGGEEQIDAHLENVSRTTTDDNVWLEHRMPIDAMNTKTSSQIFRLPRIFQDGSLTSMKKIFPGLSLIKMDRELSKLSRKGDESWAMAKLYKENGKYPEMEAALRETIADKNSMFRYPAALELMKYLEDSGQDQAVLEVAAVLKREFPAFPGSYLAEAGVWERQGKNAKAAEILNLGLSYMPEQEEIRAFLNRIQK